MTANQSIYRDIASRTHGQIYIGVVGPVRSGKSTFIRKFMEEVVLPGIEDEYSRTRAADELPQSAGGRTVMTTEPKFVPDEAVSVSFGDDIEARVKLIDCVGYLIPEVIGDTENGKVRLVHTPWADEAIPFDVAAEEGTKKVIRDHSTVGLLITSDGTVGDLPRENYVKAEERVVSEMHGIGKPFAIVLNSARPDSREAEELALSLEEKYSAPVALINCMELDKSDVEGIMRLIITEFPVKEVSLNLPGWVGVLEADHPIRRGVSEAVREAAEAISRVGDIGRFRETLTEGVCKRISADDGVYAEQVSMSMGSGRAEISLRLPDRLFYRTIGEMTGIQVRDEADLLSNLRVLADSKREYDRFADAIDRVNEKGYGIVMPSMEDMTLDEPEIVKHSGGFGIRLRATAPSIHMIKADIETELNPIVGTEQQSEELVKYLLSEFDEDPSGIWSTNLFGKSIYELVNEGLHAKLDHMPDDARERLGETLARVINEGASGLICILL